MGIDRIFHIPVFNTPKVSESKGNGSETGRSAGLYNFKPNDLGISYALGMGCSENANCFECPHKDCTFREWNRKDRKYYSNRGDGVKP